MERVLRSGKNTAALPKDLKTWAEAQVAAGCAVSIDALAACVKNSAVA